MIFFHLKDIKTAATEEATDMVVSALYKRFLTKYLKELE